MALLNSEEFFGKVKSMVKCFAEDTVLQAIYSKLLCILQAIHHLESAVW